MVQAVVNGRKLFIDVAAGFPGSLHDARVLRNSSIYQKAENGDILAAGPMYLIGTDEIQPYLVGDSAYQLSPWLQKPYPEGTRDPGEIRFNKELSSARVVVECAIGILKSRWRILDAIEERNIAAVSKIIVACAVLHNFCILAGDEWDEDDFNDDDDNGPNNNDDVLRDGDDIKLKRHMTYIINLLRQVLHEITDNVLQFLGQQWKYILLNNKNQNVTYECLIFSCKTFL